MYIYIHIHIYLGPLTTHVVSFLKTSFGTYNFVTDGLHGVWNSPEINIKPVSILLNDDLNDAGFTVLVQGFLT